MKNTTRMKWEDLGSNQIIQGKDFYISFNSSPGGDISFFKSDNASAETALCITRNSKTHFLILNGDFRKEYEKAIKNGLGACLNVYIRHKKENGSSWTTGTDIETWLKRRLWKR